MQIDHSLLQYRIKTASLTCSVKLPLSTIVTRAEPPFASPFVSKSRILTLLIDVLVLRGNSGDLTRTHATDTMNWSHNALVVEPCRPCNQYTQVYLQRIRFNVKQLLQQRKHLPVRLHADCTSRVLPKYFVKQFAGILRKLHSCDAVRCVDVIGEHFRFLVQQSSPGCFQANNVLSCFAKSSMVVLFPN